MPKTTRLFLLLAFLAIVPFSTAADRGPLPTPSAFLKFQVGADRHLADYRQIHAYFKALAAASDRLLIENIGKSTLGEQMFVAVISSPENLRNQAKYREIAHKLAHPRGLSKEQLQALAHDGKSIFLLTCNIHATEIGSTQMA